MPSCDQTSRDQTNTAALSPDVLNSDPLSGDPLTTELPGGAASPFTVTITHNGRDFLVTPPMAGIFLDQARRVVDGDESQLVVLAHAAGVDLLLVTPLTPLCAVDAGTQPPALLWDAAHRHPVDEAAAVPVGEADEPAGEATATPLHQRVLAATYPLVVHGGVRTLSIEEIEAASGAPRAAIEREFGSRDELVRQCLQLRERQWTLGMVQAGAQARGTTPESRLLAIFDVFDEWFHRDDYEACTFINVLVEMGKSHPLGRLSIKHLENIRDIVATLAREANLRDPVDFALSWHVLMKGSIMNATEGDTKAAIRAKEMARDLIARYRRPAAAGAVA